MKTIRLKMLLTLAIIGLFTWGTALAMRATAPEMMLEEKAPEPEQLKAFAKDINQFGVDLFQRLRRTEGNLFLSPYSISSALAMTTTGARGETAVQMTKVLHLPADAARFSGLHQGLISTLLSESKNYDIRIANAVWGAEYSSLQT